MFRGDLMDVAQITALTNEQLKQCPSIAIPEMLKRPEFRFVKLKPFEKKAYEILLKTPKGTFLIFKGAIAWIEGGSY